MTTKLLFLVSVPIVEGVSRMQIADYIREAVEGWSGGFDPDNPLFGAFHSARRRIGVQSTGKTNARRRRA